MKKLVLSAVLAMATVSSFAVPVKTSKPVPLTSSQMEQVKGEGIVTVYSWTDHGYVVSEVSDSGPNGPTTNIYIGGPNDTYGH